MTVALVLVEEIPLRLCLIRLSKRQGEGGRAPKAQLKCHFNSIPRMFDEPLLPSPVPHHN